MANTECGMCDYWNNGQCHYEPQGAWDVAPCEVLDDLLAEDVDEWESARYEDAE